MLAKSVTELPQATDKWLYEVKLDGYRCFAARDSRGVTLWSRRGNVFNKDFPTIARACDSLPTDTLLDGEVVALDERGRASFNLIQHHRSRASAIRFYAFDLLIYHGRSLLALKLTERRALLAEALAFLDQSVRLSENFEVEPDELLRGAKELGFEGIVAKRKDSLYEPGKRSGAWLKYKLNHSEEFVIGGYTPGSPFDALIVGDYHEDKLAFCREGQEWLCASPASRSFQKTQAARNAECPVRQSPGKKTHAVGADARRNEKLPLGSTGTCRSNRIHRVDTRWPFA